MFGHMYGEKIKSKLQISTKEKLDVEQISGTSELISVTNLLCSELWHHVAPSTGSTSSRASLQTDCAVLCHQRHVGHNTHRGQSNACIH